MLKKFYFPFVRCPAGCNEYIEKAKPIPFHHYIHNKLGIQLIPGNSDGRKLTGRRADWPGDRIHDALKLKSSACFNVDDKLGFVTFGCENHGELPDQIIHVPYNPVLSSQEFMTAPDTYATCVYTPNILKPPGMRKYNPKHFVTSALGSFKGMSAGHLSTNPRIDTPADDRLGIANTISMVGRKDVRQSIIERDVPGYTKDFGENAVQYHYNWLKKSKRMFPSEDDLRNALNGSSFMSVDDAHFINTILRSTDSVSSTNGKKVDFSNFLLKIVHTDEQYGHEPFPMASVTKKDGELEGLLISLELHCRLVINSVRL
jgi:hypothetical protein